MKTRIVGGGRRRPARRRRAGATGFQQGSLDGHHMHSNRCARDAKPFATPPSATRRSGVTESACTWPSPAPTTAAWARAFRPKWRWRSDSRWTSNALPRSLQRAIARGKVDLEDPATTLELLKLDAVVGVTGFFDEQGTHHLDGHPVCVLSFDRRQLVREGHRPPARRLGQSRSQRRRHRGAGAAARAGGAVAGHRRRDRAHGAQFLGARAASTRCCSSTARRSGPTANPPRC